MNRIIRLSSFLFLFSAIVLVSSCEEDMVADPDVFLVTGLELAGGQEVPVVSTTGSGSLDARYDRNKKELHVTFAWANLSDSVTGIQIQGPAIRGVVGPVLVPFTNFSRNRSSTYSSTVLVDEITLKEIELLRGEYYINIQSKTHPAGELRGQIVFE
ncbi:MAG TPA: CHRD domain-containing protein [Segetibacter sp.]|jgi:hypothetical protein